MSDGSERHGRLDDDASARLDEMIAIARQAGLGTGPGMLMSNAIRVLHALATGEAALVVREDAVAPMTNGADKPGELVRH